MAFKSYLPKGGRALAATLLATVWMSQINSTFLSIPCVAADQHKSIDKVQTLSTAIGRLQSAKDSVSFWAARLKYGNVKPKVLIESKTLYDETRLAFNAWVDAVLTDFTMRNSFKETADYKPLVEDANKKATIFLRYAKAHDPIRLVSGDPGEGIGILNNIQISADLSKLMDQVGQTCVALTKSIIDTVNFFHVRNKIEGLRMQPFSQIEENANFVLVTPSKEELVAFYKNKKSPAALATLAKLNLLDARMLFATGHIEAGVAKYSEGLESIVGKVKDTSVLTEYDEKYVQDYVNTLSDVSATAALENSNAELTWFMKWRHKHK